MNDYPVCELTAEEKAELAAIEAIAPDARTTDQIIRELELSSQQEEFEEAAAARADAEPDEDAGIKTITSGGGTLTRFRVVAGRKQIIEELIPVQDRAVLTGKTQYFKQGKEVSESEFYSTEAQVGDSATTLRYRLKDLGPKVLAGDPDAVKAAEEIGLVAVVKWYRSVLPSRVKQVANPDSQDLPRGDAAAVVSEVQAKAAYSMTRRKIIRMASDAVTDDPRRARAIAKAISITEEGRMPSHEEIVELEAIELDLPKE